MRLTGVHLSHRVQDYFTHYPAHDLLATTHLVLKRPEGDKYRHALQWGVPAVADRYKYSHIIWQTCVIPIY